ncbi:Vitellin-degrading protease [Smittium culicis]|uniref:Vitellin-degrading protease n=1 Tax=Smittium culicis TaxID=133412 RepID=A0A1R1Y2A7_9FUNG|nr:Vitellin-degrading protease [Smittium culicis]
MLNEKKAYKLFGVKSIYTLCLAQLVASRGLNLRDSAEYGIGVDQVDFSEVKSLALIRNAGRNTPCSGVLVSKDTVISVAHCFNNIVDSDSLTHLSITFGSSKNSSAGLQTFNVDEFTVHPDWVNAVPYENDLVILKLDSCVSDDIATPGQMFMGKAESISSMSIYSHGLYNNTGYIETGPVKIQTKFGGYTTCVKYHPDSAVNGDVYCTKLSQRSKYCFGDSGGALVNEGDNKVIGLSSHILSNTLECSASSSVGIVAHLSNFRKFFESEGATCSDSGCTFPESCNKKPFKASNDSNISKAVAVTTTSEYSKAESSNTFVVSESTSVSSTSIYISASSTSSFSSLNISSTPTTTQTSSPSSSPSVIDLPKIEIVPSFNNEITNRTLVGDYSVVSFNYNITHKMIYTDSGFELYFNARQNRDLQFEISNGDPKNRTATILARFGLASQSFALTYVDFVKNIETISISTKALVTPMTNYRYYIKFSSCGIYLGADYTQFLFLPASKFDMTGFMANKDLFGYFDNYSTTVSTISNSLNMYYAPDPSCSGITAAVKGNSTPCEVDLLNTISLNSNKGPKYFDLNNRLSLPCTNNEFNLSFDIVSDNDFYIQLSTFPNLVSTNKTITATVGLKSGRSSLTAGVSFNDKRQVVSSGSGSSHIVVRFAKNVYSLFVNNSNPINYKDESSTFYKYINFATFSGNAVISNAQITCNYDAGCPASQ